VTQIDVARTLAEPLAAELQLDLVDVEWLTEGGRRILRVTIDRPGGITHDHCETLSRRLDAALEASGALGDQPFHLEVSSPGAERPLKTPEDFRRFAGRRVFLKGREPIEGRRHWKGDLVGLAGDAVCVRTEIGEIAIPRSKLSVVRLSLD
ncbi:MAG: ribosome maturation factor RimP, partial [Cyanobacteria bacterium REEB65]|nr:ribosome maturation factor RimP [Cyanobacteria bacterium REEB65]